MSATAQISTGEPTAKKIRTGNRPQEGDFGLYLGMTSNMFKNLADNDIKMDPLPLINLKYMLTDNWEARVGLEFYRTRETLKTEIETEGDNGNTYTLDGKYKYVESQNHINPGIAYHFNSKNILDVYMGAEATIGWSRNSVYHDYSRYMEGGVQEGYDNTRKASFQLGAGAFIGLQAFIGDLPLAIGVEYGISTLFDTRLRYKNESQFGDGDEVVTYSPCMEDLPNLAKMGIQGDDFDGLKASKGKIGNQFRITLSYYFK